MIRAKFHGFHYFRENFTLSHAPERKEKVCLNCNAELYGLYCHVCGQQNAEPKETVWGLITHFFYDITHFDGKFFSSLKYLIIKPGFLPAEYIKGRRASYLNPIRMYVFTSALFFIIFFSVTNLEQFEPSLPSTSKLDSALNMRAAATQALKYTDTKEDSAVILEALSRLNNSIEAGEKDSSQKNPVDTAAARKKNKKRGGWNFNLTKNEVDYTNAHQYDSIQSTLPPDKRDDWLMRVIRKREIALRKKYGDNSDAMWKAWLSTFIHQFPKLLFVSLPLFALILRLLYIRRKQFYYVDHGIFSIHLYIFSFILLLVSLGISELYSWLGWGLFDWLQGALWLYFFYYNYKAMRNFYRQGRGKTIVKFILLNILALISIIILFLVFFIFAAFQL